MPILELRNASKSFGALKVTDDVSFALEPGEALGIIGPNGAGKSTLFNLITGNLRPDAGTVLLDGTDVTRAPPMARALAGVGRSFQIPQPFAKLTVFENLVVAGAFGSAATERNVTDRCAGILERTGLIDRANVPAGSLTLLQRKRLELARALATDPKVLLLDEIAGGLTEAEGAALVETIKGVHAQGVAILWIEHVLHALTAVVTRLLVLDFGKVIGMGDPDEVMARREVRGNLSGDRGMTALLQTQGLEARYGDFQALFGIDVALEEGETIAIIGANGAGKTTFMRSVSGVLRNAPDEVTLAGTPIGAMPPEEIVRLGLAMVPEGRRLFPSLTVEENLLMGRYGRDIEGPWTLDTVYELFPILRDRRNGPGTALSGGQQQMVAIGRALMSNPRVLLCDELSLGLAPVVIRDIYAALPTIKARGASVIVVEQDIGQALKVADRVYCFMEGRVTLSGTPGELSRDAIHQAYFGA